jgi:YggT family protein
MIPIFELLVQVIELYKFVLIVAVIMSWLVAFNVINTSNRFVYTVNDFLYRVTEPALRPIRRFVPNLGGVDISPIVLILLLWFVQRMIEVNIIYA